MFNATIIEREQVTGDLIILKIKPDFSFPNFKAGQYLALGICQCDYKDEVDCHMAKCHMGESQPQRRILKRAYSIASSPEEKEYLEFYISILPNGAFTFRLDRLGPGHRILVTPKPVGTFTLDGVPETVRLFFVSTGTGIAPYMSMLRSPGIWTHGWVIRLVHGVRYESELAYCNELSALSQSRPELRYYPMLSREDPTSAQITKGRVQKLFEEGILGLNPATDHIFLCGNPSMIENMQVLLENRGFKMHSKKSPGNIHLEKYW